jgi:hypothetical protein
MAASDGASGDRQSEREILRWPRHEPHQLNDYLAFLPLVWR